MSLGMLSQKYKEIINTRFFYNAPSHIPRLYFTNKECDNYSEYRLSQINAALHEFISIDFNPEGNQFQIPCLSKVKVGALVMLRKNLTEVLFNGRIGTITKIESELIHVALDDKEVGIKRYNEEHHNGNEVVASRIIFPLIFHLNDCS